MVAHRPVQLADVRAAVLAALDVEIRESAAPVEVGVMPTVSGDREALYRVFANLIESAVKYRKRDASTPRIVVSASPQGALWRVAVGPDLSDGICIEVMLPAM